MLLIDTCGTFFWAINTGVAKRILAWWAVVGPGANVLGCVVCETIHACSARNCITDALAARELAILAGVHLGIEVLVVSTLLAVQVTVVRVLGKSSWACIDTCIWCHQRTTLLIAPESEKLCCWRTDSEAETISVVGSWRTELHANILIEHQIVRAA